MRLSLLAVYGVPILVLLALALPPALKRKSWLRFFVALVLSFAVVVLPLFVFLASAFLVPDWKGGCNHGWLDCFIMGKLALSPVALFATAALYSVEVLRVENPTKKWIVLGIFSGAVVAVVCLVYGLTCLAEPRVHFGRLDRETWGWIRWLLVPLYVAIWYSVRAGQLVKASKLGPRAYLGTLLGSLPFWFGSILWSRNIYASLPDTAPSCFVVTAAGRGHKKFVGPFVEIQHHGRRIQANQQLITLRRFENLWRQRAPHSHRCFRVCYNRLGPAIAAQIRSPWLADLAYVAIKPAELAARLAITTAEKIKFNG